MDFFPINGHPYFTMIVGKVNDQNIKTCRGHGKNKILDILQTIVDQHNKGGFRINEYHADNEFKNIEAYLIPSTIHSQVAGEHEPTAESNIRTLKDTTRSTVSSVTYRKMPLLIIGAIAEQLESTLNDFPSKTGISTILSSKNII